MPLQQAEVLVAKYKECGAATDLIVKKGVGHGWAGMPTDAKQITDWFDQYLVGGR